MNAVMAYMLADWYRPGVTLDFPKGGSGAIVDALVRGVEKYGGKVCVNCHVDDILVKDGRAVGVTLSDGRVVHAKTGGGFECGPLRYIEAAIACPTSW